MKRLIVEFLVLFGLDIYSQKLQYKDQVGFTYLPGVIDPFIEKYSQLDGIPSMTKDKPACIIHEFWIIQMHGIGTNCVS